MKKQFMFLFVSLIILLAACSNGNDNGSVDVDNEGSKLDDTTEVEQNEADNKTEVINDDLEDKKNPIKESTDAVSAGENLLTTDLVYEYNDGDIVLTIDLAEFTQDFSTSTGEDTHKKSIAESKILFHLKGNVNNDTLDIFSYGHQLGQVTFKLVYDNKHEFELLGLTESLDGSEFIGASVDSLQEQIIHLFADVPVPVSEGDKSLVLVISDSDGDHQEVLR